MKRNQLLKELVSRSPHCGAFCRRFIYRNANKRSAASMRSVAIIRRTWGRRRPYTAQDVLAARKRAVYRPERALRIHPTWFTASAAETCKFMRRMRRRKKMWFREPFEAFPRTFERFFGGFLGVAEMQKWITVWWTVKKFTTLSYSQLTAKAANFWSNADDEGTYNFSSCKES